MDKPTKGKKTSVRKLEDLLTENSNVASHNLKLRLLQSQVIEYNCYICKLSSWLDKPLSLQLDHINGNHLDNRLENLRLLCPNCHSQTDTYCGKKSKGPRKKPEEYIKYTCNCCGKNVLRIQNKLGLCSGCRKNKYGGKLTTEQIISLKSDYENKILTTKEVLKKYDISSSTLYKILRMSGDRF